MYIDLNCDLGEGYPNDAALMPLISSANIACGYHAGDTETMRRTINLAVEHDVAIGAHPGFADKENFGRRDIQLSKQGYYDLVLTQLEAIKALVVAAGATLHHVKPHGALYNMAARDPELAYIMAHAVLDFDPKLALFGLSGSHSITQAEALGLKTASEVFADRSYQPDASLTPRSQPGALITDADKCLHQVLGMVQKGQVEAVDGSIVPIKAETLCLHGDGEHAVAFAQQLQQVFLDNNIAIKRP
jgi:5-oxoprolinase (ATP-hydrolysing) subunit A